MKIEHPPQEAVGGQAVIEGVMMRTPRSASVAVRRPDGGIAVRHRPWQSLTARVRPLGWPFVRGAVVLVESLSGGMDALRFSAEAAGLEESDGKGGKPRGAFVANVALVLGVVLALLLFKGVPHGVALWSGLQPTQVLFHVVDGGAKLLLVFGYIAAISRMKDIQRVFAYHGAEHKSIRAFEVGGGLTVAEAQGESRLHPRCGTSFIVVVVLASVALYIALSPLIPRAANPGILFQAALVLAKILLLAPVAAIAYEVNRLAGRHWTSPIARGVAWPGMVMQRLLTTREPEDAQVEVALVALRTALDERRPDRAGEKAEWQLDNYDSYAEFMAQRGDATPGGSDSASKAA